MQTSNAFLRRIVVLLAPVLPLLISSSSVRAQYTNGIYAEFYTSMGSYTCRLEYVAAPKAVANFIGLATGQRAWLDLPTGLVRTNPFYNGTTFHRVIAGFMNQGGSRNGQGTDGPGYQFIDEFTPTLRHTNFGVLSMANAGPDSNGSQFFITVSPQPQLNDVHTVFGRLYGGSNVVYAINRVATGANDKPLTNVVLHNVVIHREGASAQAFDIHAQGLPTVTSLGLRIAKAGPNMNLTFSNRLSAENFFYFSGDLNAWGKNELGIGVNNPLPDTVQVSGGHPRQFFRMAQVQYPPPLFVPGNLFGRTLTLNFSGGIGTFVVAFDQFGGGSYTWTGGLAGSVLGYVWTQDPYRGRLFPFQMDGFVIMGLHLDYDSAGAGTFKGNLYPAYPNPGTAVSGTFTSSP